MKFCVGLASYHFAFPLSANNGHGGSYIAYHNAPSFWHLENKDELPEKKYFLNPSYNEDERIFTGLIDWSNNKFENSSFIEYEMVFSEDFKNIVGGEINFKNENNNIIKTYEHLATHRYDLFPKSRKKISLF